MGQAIATLLEVEILIATKPAMGGSVYRRNVNYKQDNEAD
jgi:hypothetical protein